MENWNEIRKHFNFINDYNFYGPIIYLNGPEVNFDYISKKSIINITYEPGYEFLTKLVKLKTDFKKIEPDKIRWRALKSSEFKVYNIGLFLDPKNKIRDSIRIKDQGDKNLEYYSKLLKTNPKVLDNDFSDFTIPNLIKKWLS
ncbi:hypothetical protein [Croceibacter atlanticus]|jgi:hypothetical protein|uniref:hypothetical protein n=1 Tax=Croceibacter atlanticus TaxID=313588 RepID=UPI000C916A40|nr:hypothetical protein [Croceibacter sp.]WSP35100.1 hypothetical protein VVL01_03295 [Croceibacter atlanticus]|tara:strand:- start:45999 stop:46427 length:429 start_codon:yes stop_codon:yes gene_type:complete